ncbi:MAG: glycosyltransferase family 2 protein [Phascolarctobacterium sp.]|nr:glycosyltransferase family 2 protein [Phascolarctobacterium sp.]
MSVPVTVVLPTCNAGSRFRECAEILAKQSANIAEVLVIDSSSDDETVDIAKDYGFHVEVIAKPYFGHGKTRQYALEKAQTEIVVFMTQDALLKDEYAVQELIEFLLSDEALAAVYGRQLPYPHTGPLGSFARLYNYPDYSFINTFADKKKKGIKTAFLSDSFAAYKKSLLLQIGGFPKHVNFGEDTYAAAKLLMAGYKTGYCAEAMVYHAHDYSLQQEFLRCRQIGQFHKEETWLLETFGKAEGEGLRYIVQEARYLMRCEEYLQVGFAFIHNMVKYFGYKTGVLI